MWKDLDFSFCFISLTQGCFSSLQEIISLTRAFLIYLVSMLPHSVFLTDMHILKETFLSSVHLLASSEDCNFCRCLLCAVQVMRRFYPKANLKGSK